MSIGLLDFYQTNHQQDLSPTIEAQPTWTQEQPTLAIHIDWLMVYNVCIILLEDLMKKILLTGGGTAGHVMPHLALLPYLKKQGYHIDYIGSYKGIEKTLIEKEKVPYYGIASGKLRRYFDWQNFTDLFRIALGIVQATYRIQRLKPDVVFSKGGFVTVPVVIGAWINQVPVVVHESDMTPGLANKIALKFSKKICTTFEKTLKYLPSDKAVFTGAPIRKTVLEGSKEKGFNFTGLDQSKPTILLTGGSLGAKALNQVLRESLPDLSKTFNVIHLCGKDNLVADLNAISGYCQYEFIGEELPDLFAISDYIVSRAGSNTITEILALQLPNLLIPLPASQSRGDQLVNAKVFEDLGYSLVLQEEDLNVTTFIDAISSLVVNRTTYIDTMASLGASNGTQNILKVINATSKK